MSSAGPGSTGVDAGIVDVGGRPVRLTSLDKVLWPGGGGPGGSGQPATTKGQLVAYLAAVAVPLLAQLADRPASRIRWPHGVGGESFVEKNVPKGSPEWLRTVVIEGYGSRSNGPVTYPLVDDVAGLVWAAQLAALEFHTPQWRVGASGVLPPDRLVIDLDPGPGTGLAQCAALAHRVAERLGDDGLSAVPVTSGSSGLHLYVPLAGDQEGALVHAYARRLAERLARDEPLATAVMTKSARTGKVLLDWSQNSPAKTTLTPYSPRGRAGATAAAPRRWLEIGDGLRQLTMVEVAARLEVDGDLMAQVPSIGPRLPDVR